ncbi:MAG: hypothetical protein GY807_16435 [Gammaproteobacteria bacterium]|nr:hypothetical protein [Gammaproteobacteria bacterium]
MVYLLSDLSLPLHVKVRPTLIAKYPSLFIAIQGVEVAYMISVKRTSLLFGLLYGALLFSEPRLGHNLLAGSLMVSGVALLAVYSDSD